MPDRRISICMTTYNGGPFIGRQLECFAAQTRRPDELVVCDDRSTDETVAIVRRFAQDASFPVRLEVNPENIGIRRNFEKAIRLSTGDILFLSDQDDVWHPQKLARFEDTFDEDPGVGLVFADANVVDVQLRSLGYTFWKRLEFGPAEQARFEQDRGFEVLLRHCFVAGATLAFRAEYKGLVLPLSERWLYDAWIAMLISAAAKSRIVREPMNDYRQHPSQAMGGQKKGLWRRYVEAKRAVAAAFFVARAEEHQAVRDRLVERGDAREPILGMLEAKVRHCRERATMRRRAWLRAPLVIKELAAGRYHRYAHGWKTAALDLFV